LSAVVQPDDKLTAFSAPAAARAAKLRETLLSRYVSFDVAKWRQPASLQSSRDERPDTCKVQTGTRYARVLA